MTALAVGSPAELVAKDILLELAVAIGRRTLIKVSDPIAPDWQIVTSGIRVLPAGAEADLLRVSTKTWLDSARFLARALAKDIRHLDPAYILTTDDLPQRAFSTRATSTREGWAVYVAYVDGWLSADVIVGGSRYVVTSHFYPVAF